MQPEFSKSLNVSRETIERLEIYLNLLRKWQKAVNLISPSTLNDAWQRHFVDSAQLLPFIPQHVKIIGDLGCGAGFPGLVLAILEPRFTIHLVESDDKKCQFLRTVSRETNANVTVHNKRVEASYEDFTPDLLTARALASLKQLLSYSRPWADKNPKLDYLFLKGAKADQEIEEAQTAYAFKCETFESETEADARILRMSDVTTL